MKTVTVTAFGGPEVMVVRDQPSPEPGEGQVRVAIRAAGVNYADLLQREGLYPGGPQPPYIAGFEFAGEVEVLGFGVVGWSKGDRVMGMCRDGGYAESVVVPVASLMKIPDNLGFPEGAAIPCQFLTAYHALLTLGQLRPGQTVLIQAAAGGLGTLLVQIAKKVGARVIGTCGTDEKCALITELGCDHPINYRDRDFRTEVMEITNNQGCELIVESVGGRVFDLSLRCLKPMGRLIVLGVASKDPRPVYAAYLLPNNLTVSGFHLSGYLTNREAMANAVRDLYDWTAKGEIRFVVNHQFRLEEAAEAHRRIAARETSGKVVLLP